MIQVISRKYLRHTHNNHYKHYFIALLYDDAAPALSQYRVHSAWGRIGNTPQELVVGGWDNSRDAFLAIDEIVNEKLNKGYSLAWERLETTNNLSQLWKSFAGVKANGLTKLNSYPHWFSDLRFSKNFDNRALGKTNLQNIPREKKPKKEDPKRIFRKNAPWNF